MTPRHGAELPQLELDCMIVLWQRGECAAGAIRQVLATRGRPLAYTTIHTVLQRLGRKRMVTARKQGRTFLFSPSVSRDAMRAQAVERLVRNYFDSGEELRHYLEFEASTAGAVRRSQVATAPPLEAVNGAPRPVATAAERPAAPAGGPRGAPDAPPANDFDASLL